MSSRGQKRYTHRERERIIMKRRVTGIVIYSVVITIAFALLLLLYGIQVRAEAKQEKAADQALAGGSEDGEKDVPAEGGMEALVTGIGEAAASGDGLISDRALPEVDLTDWNMILVNRWNMAPADYTVELAEIEQGYQADARIVDELRTMLEDARKEGLSPRICSAYRSNRKQVRLYNNKVREYLNKGYSAAEAQEEAGKWVAIPGTSEHETGLAVDIVATDYQLLDEGQENTKEQQWLMDNSWKYGFILRYPGNKSEKTGIYYEPWHYRYVGKEVAEIIYEMDVCFEEYLELIKQNSTQ